MIEMPRNVAKCLLFRNVLHEKLIGEEKALLISIFFISPESQGCRAKGITACHEHGGPGGGPQMVRPEPKVRGGGGESAPLPCQVQSHVHPPGRLGSGDEGRDGALDC